MSLTKEIQIKDIDIVENHRIDIGNVGLQELMLSIKQHGLKQAIGVSTGDNNRYRLLFGQRRLLACQKLGWKDITASVEEKVSLEDSLIANLVENMQRVDPSFAELGRVVKRLEDEIGLATGEVSARLGINYGKINTIKKVYKGLPEKYRQRVFFMAKGKTRNKGSKDIPAGVAIKLVKMKKDHGLSDKALDGLVDHATKKGANQEDLENIAILMRSGADINSALKSVNEFKVFAFSFVANAEQVADVMLGDSVLNQKSIFAKIMYGELPPLARPYFLRNDLKPVTKKTKAEKNKHKKIRLTTMMFMLNTKVRLNETTAEETKIIEGLSKIKTGDLNDPQIEQIKELYSKLR